MTKVVLSRDEFCPSYGFFNGLRVGKKRLDYVSRFDISGEVFVFGNWDAQDLLIVLGFEREFNEPGLRSGNGTGWQVINDLHGIDDPCSQLFIIVELLHVGRDVKISFHRAKSGLTTAGINTILPKCLCAAAGIWLKFFYRLINLRGEVGQILSRLDKSTIFNRGRD